MGRRMGNPTRAVKGAGQAYSHPPPVRPVATGRNINEALAKSLTVSAFMALPAPNSGAHMKFLLVAFGLSAAIVPAAAQPQTRVFIIASYADGYGVDRCLAT